MTKRNKDKLVEGYSEDYFSNPDGSFEIVNPSNENVVRKKLDKAEELLKNIYQWVLSNDALEEESEDQYVIRIINEIPHIKEDINTFFRETV
tara:strand:+ start:2646 stop:2921 length:276 start_codon:yes stop_codon:yes gene_type:complete